MVFRDSIVHLSLYDTLSLNHGLFLLFSIFNVFETTGIEY
jgi:hypothetical protein